jgi:hypothetical protein
VTEILYTVCHFLFIRLWNLRIISFPSFAHTVFKSGLLRALILRREPIHRNMLRALIQRTIESGLAKSPDFTEPLNLYMRKTDKFTEPLL